MISMIRRENLLQNNVLNYPFFGCLLADGLDVQEMGESDLLWRRDFRWRTKSRGGEKEGWGDRGCCAGRMEEKIFSVRWTCSGEEIERVGVGEGIVVVIEVM